MSASTPFRRLSLGLRKLPPSSRLIRQETFLVVGYLPHLLNVLLSGAVPVSINHVLTGCLDNSPGGPVICLIQLKTLTFTHKLLPELWYSPCLLFEARAAIGALGPARVVLAPAQQLLGVGEVGNVASVGMTIAHAPPTDANVFYWIEVLKLTRHAL